jgi:cellulose synthase/poly-beta-1,6-N-acetylglucosamine synthase-like glycosyltransferase/spore germination protein YaaH/peptidoglycan/xylan/chitin deacetylase (PgdA/CDA1 family)
MSTSFVFYDPTGRRWIRFRRAFGITGIALAVLIVLFILSLVSNPQLPALGLPSVQHLANFGEVAIITKGEKAAKAIPYRFRKVVAPIKYVRNGGNPLLHPKLAAKEREDQPLVFGFYVNWDDASKVSLRLNLHHLTHLLPEWLTLKNGAGDVTDETDDQVVQIARDAKLPILVEVNNYREGWQAGDLHQMLNSTAARANLIDNIYSNIREHNFAGVNIDLEQLSPRDRDKMVLFMQELRAHLSRDAPSPPYLLTQATPTDDEAFDLKRLAEINDYIVPMVYDEHYQTSSPGPVASEHWYADQLDRLGDLVPRSKTVIGLGNYGYDWIIGSRKGGVEVSYSDVVAAAEANKVKLEWDTDAKNPVLRYTNGPDQHEIWFLDAVTALNHMRDVSDEGFRGVGIWRLGAEDPGLWTVFGSHNWPNNSFDPVSLFKLTAQKSVQHYGEGEVLRITDWPHDGSRNVWKDKEDDFHERYQKLPSYYVVEHSGGAPQKNDSPKQVSITFDDGPSEYTDQVLDVLKQKNVPATFFVIGQNAEEFPSAIKREYNEGHIIGNHTYSHPNIAVESDESTRFELSMTLRLIEHDTGRSTILFRPPYNADSVPQTPAELVPIDRAQGRGYVTIGEKIDPRDWEKGSTAEKILKEVLDQKEDGKLILLHDGGGDRTSTIAALPLIIDTLREQGYVFVGLDRLMGRSRAELMPVPSRDEKRWASIEGQALTTKGNFKKAIGLLFLIAIYLTLLRSLVYGILAIIEKRKASQRPFDAAFIPPVSVVIAAYNEEKVIARTIRSILENGYPELEVVIVDDGSKDRTLAVVRESYGSDSRVRILTQPNRGKAAALNYGFRESRHGLLVAVDADTIFESGTIAKLMRHFSNPMVGAVSGNARVGNRKKWITRFQSIEYICGFNLDRRALDLLNAITVVPGAVGAWRKDLVLRAGGFGDDTLAEDTDLTLAIRRLGFEIRYEEQAVAYTEAPETTRDLAKQRFRWAFGTLQAAWKHRDATFNPNYGFLGMLALPSIWIFQVLLAALSPFAEIAMFIALFAGNWRIVLLYYCGLFLLEFLTAVLAYSLERARPWDLGLLFFQRIYYRQLMYYVLAKSILYAMRGRLVGWGKLERRATVQA